MNIKAFGSKIYLYYCDYYVIFAKTPPLGVRPDKEKGVKPGLLDIAHTSPMGIVGESQPLAACIS